MKRGGRRLCENHRKTFIQEPRGDHKEIREGATREKEETQGRKA
jgi:hypothetical protein